MADKTNKSRLANKPQSKKETQEAHSLVKVYLHMKVIDINNNNIIDVDGGNNVDIDPDHRSHRHHGCGSGGGCISSSNRFVVNVDVHCNPSVVDDDDGGDLLLLLMSGQHYYDQYGSGSKGLKQRHRSNSLAHHHSHSQCLHDLEPSPLSSSLETVTSPSSTTTMLKVLAREEAKRILSKNSIKNGGGGGDDDHVVYKVSLLNFFGTSK